MPSIKRRHFLSTAAAGLAQAEAADPPRNALYQLLYFHLRTGSQVDRTTRYLEGVFLPAAKRAGLTSAFFSPVIGEGSPFILSLVSYPSFAALETSDARFADDKEFQKGWDEYNDISNPAYIRLESALLRAFNGMPAIEVPPTEGRRPARIFELRTYESVNEKASQRKIKMFNDGEIAIFRRLGMAPVFFGQGMVGRNLPSLTYMLAFDDLAARERLWRSFGADPEWQKLRSQPGLSDAEIVSNISNSILRPLPFSAVR
jgi:hypothetical protein